MFKSKFLIVVLISFLYVLTCTAAFEIKPQGVDNFSSGSSGIAVNNTAFAVFINPAITGLIYNSGINVFYRNFYGIKEINQISLAGHFHLFRLPVGAGISTFGNQLYRETELRAGTAIELLQQIHMGISCNLYYLDIQNYGSAMSLGFDFAFIKKINDFISAGFVLSNLNEPDIGNTGESIPARYSFGFAYQPLKNSVLSFDIVKEDNYNFDYRFGVRYNLNSWLTFMTGFCDLTNAFSAGIKVSNKDYNVNYGFQYHPDLGGSNSMSIGYAF